MHERFARAVLSGKLIFGDETQLRAKRILERVELVRSRLTWCRLCGGEGVRYRGRPRRLQLCTCVEREDRETLAALGVDVPDAY